MVEMAGGPDRTANHAPGVSKASDSRSLRQQQQHRVHLRLLHRSLNLTKATTPTSSAKPSSTTRSLTTARTVRRLDRLRPRTTKALLELLHVALDDDLATNAVGGQDRHRKLLNGVQNGATTTAAASQRPTKLGRVGWKAGFIES